MSKKLEDLKRNTEDLIGLMNDKESLEMGGVSRVDLL